MERRRLPGTPEPNTWLPGADAVRLAADAWGEAGNPLVLLLHGGGQTRHAWKGTGQKLAASGYRALALDARGHGDSDWAPGGQYEYVSMVEDLVCAAAALPSGPPILVGASMGGMVALSAVGSGRLQAAALVLVDVAPQIEESGAQRILDFMAQKPEGFESLEEVAAAIGAYQPQRATPRRLDGLAKNVRQGSDGRYYWHWDPAFLERPRSRLRERSDELRTAASQLRLPTLLVRGGLSDVLSEAGARDFLTLCAHSEYVNVTDAAHMVAGDRNDLFTAAVVDFLGRVAPA